MGMRFQVSGFRLPLTPNTLNKVFWFTTQIVLLYMTDDIQKLVEAVRQSNSAPSLIKAVGQLAATQQGEAIPTLVEVLSYNNPGAAVVAVEGLIAMGEEAVPYLLNNIDGYDYGARAWAIRALAGISDPRALELLLEAAKEDFALSVRRAAAKGLGNLRWSKLSVEQRKEAQTQVFKTLVLVCQDPEWVVRYAAVVGLQMLAAAVAETEPVGQIRQQLEQVSAADLELAVRARAQLALTQVSL